MASRGLLRRAGSVLALSLGLLVALTLPLLAHAELREAYPAPGESFRWSRPDEVRLTFSQTLDPAAEQRIVVTGPNFEPVPHETAQIDPAAPNVLRAALGELPEGRYTVNWHSESVDGHALEGSYDFAIVAWQPLITLVTAAVVLALMGGLVFLRRARPGDSLD